MVVSEQTEGEEVAWKQKEMEELVSSKIVEVLWIDEDGESVQWTPNVGLVLVVETNDGRCIWEVEMAKPG